MTYLELLNRYNDMQESQSYIEIQDLAKTPVKYDGKRYSFSDAMYGVHDKYGHSVHSRLQELILFDLDAGYTEGLAIVDAGSFHWKLTQ